MVARATTRDEYREKGEQEGVNPVALLLRESLRSAAPRLPASSPLLGLRIRGVKFVST